MQRTVVGVLRGGPSSEYEVSLQSGATVLQELDRAKYDPRDIFISRDGTWHSAGREVPISRALQGVDVAFNAMHGEYGEDGTLQRILDVYGMPYTGSASLPSAMAFNKHHAKETLKTVGVRSPEGIVLDIPYGESDIDAQAKRVFDTMPLPWVVKPMAAGSSVGVTIAKSYHDLLDGLEHAQKVSPRILVEQFISGREATCGVIENFRDQKTYVLMPIEIVPEKHNGFYNYDAKYVSDKTNFILPGNFTQDIKEQITEGAKLAHETLDLSQYSRSDFIITPKGQVYFLEVNTLPGLTSHSLIPKSVAAIGSKLSDFFDHLIQLALRRK